MSWVGVLELSDPCFCKCITSSAIKIWNLGSPDPNFTLDAHLKGVNCVDPFIGADKPYLITGSNDHTAKVWDYQTKNCVQNVEGHTHNVSVVCFHPELPIIMTGFEDGTNFTLPIQFIVLFIIGLKERTHQAFDALCGLLWWQSNVSHGNVL